MELLIVVLVLILFDVAALRWGFDSRESVNSAEADLAARGYYWGSRVHRGV
jgi:hypothetical protein